MAGYYTPPLCGHAKFSIGELRPHACSDIVFYLRASFDNSAIITEALRIELGIPLAELTCVIPVTVDPVDIPTTFGRMEVKSQAQFSQPESLAVRNRLNTMMNKELERSTWVPLTTVQNDLDLLMLEPTARYTKSTTLAPTIIADQGGMSAGPLFPPTRLKDGGTFIGWRTHKEADVQITFPFVTPEEKDVPKNIPYGLREAVNKQIGIPWHTFFVADDQTNIPWGDFTEQADAQINVPWVPILPHVDLEKRIPWESPESIQVQKGISYKAPPAKDTQKKVPWAGSFKNLLSTKVGVAFTLKVPFKDTQKTVRWGPRDLSWTPCEPGSPFDKPKCGQNWFRLDEDMEDLTGICKDVVMVLQCDNRIYNPYHYFHTGNRDSFYVKPLKYHEDEPTYGEDFYIVENTILVKRISDNEPIDIIGVSCRIDKGSWLWDFSITITEEASLELLKPYKSGNDTIFHDIEISINQNLWACRIEKWSESRVFGKDSWTLTGRSPSSELTEPFSTPESFLSGGARQGGDMVEAILSGTGWEAQWGYDDSSASYSDYLNPFVDWLIPQDGYSYSDLVKVKGVQDIIAGIGGFVQTKADCHIAGNKKLIITPNYTREPWLWGIIEPDVEIPEALCKEISRSFESYKRIDAIIVSGIDHGVIANATRMGQAGTTYGTMVTHALITTQEAGSERARSELAKTGMWSNHTLNLFSLKVPGSAVDPVTRLILPGELVQLTEKGLPWKGQASGTTVTATISTEGVKDVMQSINVEEYIG